MKKKLLKKVAILEVINKNFAKNTSTMHSKNNFDAKIRDFTMHSTMHSGGIL